MAASGLFGTHTVLGDRWSETYGTERYLELLGTQSDHGVPADDERRHVLDRFAEVIESAGGAITIDCVTKLYLSRRSGREGFSPAI